MGAPPRDPPELTLGPVVALVATLVAGLCALYLSAAAWTLGNLPDALLDAVPGLRSIGVYLGLGVPVAAVLMVGVLVGRSRWRGPALTVPWSSRRSTSGAGP